MRYQERLRVPLRWWVQIIMLLATLWLAFIIATPPWLAWTVSGVLLAFAFGILTWIGAAKVAVNHGIVYAGAAQISARHLGEPHILDRDATRNVLGVGADARAYLLTRPYLKHAVRVEILDQADPTPYWVIGTRSPESLAKAIDEARREVLG
ncbi:MAG TPA: DUF3093 domain-containing protein [Marmoricola sp.]|nr:DUF3093 domain-containing protein [Marmoricola sp.]